MFEGLIIFFCQKLMGCASGWLGVWKEPTMFANPWKLDQGSVEPVGTKSPLAMVMDLIKKLGFCCSVFI